jgi:hypothetical protein
MLMTHRGFASIKRACHVWKVPSLSPQTLLVIQQYLAIRREPGDPFWSIREIAAHFDCNRYQAERICKELAENGLITPKANKGFFLSLRPKLLRDAEKKSRPHPAIIWPSWGTHARPNSFVGMLRVHLGEAMRKKGWDLVSYDEPGMWTDPILATRLAIRRINVLIGIDPPRLADLQFNALIDSGCRLLVHGAISETIAHLKIPTIEGNNQLSAHDLAIKLRSMGCKRIVMVGQVPPLALEERFKGLSSALDEYDPTTPHDFLIAELDAEYQVLALRERFRKREKPDAVIFNTSPDFVIATRIWPGLRDNICQGLKVAVFDEAGLPEEMDDLPIIRCSLDPMATARVTISLIDGLFAKGRIPLRSVVGRVLK